MHRHVYEKYTELLIDDCIGVGVDMCIDMCMDMCIDMPLKYAATCVNACAWTA